jgi:transcriptional regulator with XRE-family HTH domain
LRAARERVGISQADLADRVGLAPSHLSRLESGEKESPRFETVSRIAAELGLSLDDVASELGLRKASHMSSEDGLEAARLATTLLDVKRRLERATEEVDASLTAIKARGQRVRARKPSRT